MEALVLACKTLENELHQAMQITGCNYEIRWIESGLHNFPEKLKDRMQKELDLIDDVKYVLMTFGNCGNSIAGIKAGNFQLVIPRVEDCISLLLGSDKTRAEITKNNPTYFLTKGWLDGERNIWTEYQYSVQKYGEKAADSIMKMMLGNYKHLGILDTKSYDIDEILPQTQIMAKTLRLEHKILPASVKYLCDLLTGPYDKDRFMIFEPNTKVVIDLIK